MRTPRFRIRTLMIVVAVAGVALGAWRLHRLATHYRAAARFAAQSESASRMKEQNFRRHVEIAQKYRTDTDYANLSERQKLSIWRLQRMSSRMNDEANSLVTHADRMAQLKIKYERAARYPWLPVEPDPPEPE